MPEIPDLLLLDENHASNTSVAETDLDDDEIIGKSTVSLPSFILNQFYRQGLIFFQLFASPSQLYRLFCSRNFIFFRLRLNLYKILKPFTLRCKKLNLVSTLYPGEVRSLEEKRKRARESLSKVIANNTVSFFPDVLVTDDPRLSHLPRDGMENWKERKLDEIFRRWPNRCWMDIFTVTQGRDFSLM